MPNIISGKWKFVDPDKELYLGYEFEKDGNRALQKRCDYCGKTMVFDIKDVEKWGNNMKIGFNGWPEKIHCNSLHCQEYHRRVIIHQETKKKELAEKHSNLFLRLKNTGFIS